MEQLYDGLNGKIIKWTLENGGTSHDPSVQAFLVARDGKVVSRCAQPYNASSMSKWLEEEVGKDEKTHPRTAVPFVSAGIVEGRCAAFDEAREARRPILLYVGRESGEGREAAKQMRAARKFEKSTLGSKKAAAEAKGWTLLRFDLADKEHAAFVKAFGVEAAPALLMFPPREEKPTNLGTRLKGPNLAYFLKKHG